MTFARQKRVLLGVLALLAPLPLPFNEPRPEGVVGFLFLVPYLVAVCWFIRRAALDRERWLRPWMLNVLGLLYVPFFLFDLSTFWRGHLVRPMMHLVMFAMVAKLFSLQQERDKWQALVGIFFLFLASMATSAHPAIVLYLVVFCSLLLGTLVRFAAYHVTGAFPSAGAASMPPLRTFLTLSTLFALVLSVPIFLTLPRVRTPYVLGRGISGAQVGYSTGFSDEVSLDIIGNIRGSREVALRAQFEAGELTSGELRFRGGVYEDYEGLGWRRSPLETALRPEDGTFHLAPGEVQEWMRIWLQPLNANTLILPVRTLEVEVPVRALGLSRGGAVSMRDRPQEVLQYRVGLGSSSVLVGSTPAAADPTLSLAGVTERIAELTRRVGGEGSPSERARRIESHLISSYEYTLDFVGRRAEDPIDDFLFTYRSGHCEYFASAMVLMLRSQGIPARFVTGFLGGEYNPLEGYFIVRQSNAHAWVEVFLPGRGWRTYDPTPPSGRPASDGSSWRLLLRQAYDYVLFRWDRYVVSYGFEDQVGVVARLRELLAELWGRVRLGEAGREGDAQSEAAGTAVSAEPIAAARRSLATSGILAGAGVVLVAGILVWWLWRAPRSATAAYRRLRRRAARHGIPVSPALGPVALRARLERRSPATAAETNVLIDLYLRESFAGRRLTEEESAQLDELLERATRGLRKAS